MGPSKRHAWVLIWMHVLLSGFSSVLPVNNVLPLESTLLNCLHSWISHGTAEQWFLNRFGKRKMTLRQQTLALTIDEKRCFQGKPTWISHTMNPVMYKSWACLIWFPAWLEHEPQSYHEWHKIQKGEQDWATSSLPQPFHRLPGALLLQIYKRPGQAAIIT